jgi:xylulokinase
MEQMASNVEPGAGGLIFHPYLSGERSPVYDPDLRADFLGVSAAHSSAHFFRAVLEGVAMSLSDCVDAFDTSIPSGTEFVIIGGGSRSPLWVSILSDVLGRPLRMGPPMAAARGAAIVAQRAIGLETNSKARVSERVEPDPTNVARYAQLMDIYRDSAKQTAGLSRRLTEFARNPPVTSG